MELHLRKMNETLKNTSDIHKEVFIYNLIHN